MATVVQGLFVDNGLMTKFVFEGQRQTGDKLTKWRVTIKPNNGKVVDFLEERSVDNGDWKESARFQYKPAPEQKK